jgi:hypothetical protein
LRDELTFVIGSEEESTSFGLLSKAIDDIRRLLRDIDYSIYGPRAHQDWRIISLRSSAPTITIAPGRADTESVGVIAEGLQMITEGTDQTPHRFTEPVFEDLKRMRRLFQGKGKASSIAVRMDDKEVATIQKDIAVKVDRVLSAGHHNLGSIQGRLEAINVHKSPTATIWDRISGSPVRWMFPRNDIDRVKTLLEKSVIVMGDIYYFSNGAPRSISNVVDIQEFKPTQHSERAGFGSIPDRGVQEMGAAQWLQVVRGEGQQ